MSKSAIKGYIGCCSWGKGTFKFDDNEIESLYDDEDVVKKIENLELGQSISEELAFNGYFSVMRIK